MKRLEQEIDEDYKRRDGDLLATLVSALMSWSRMSPWVPSSRSLKLAGTSASTSLQR